jgi:alpha-beta hydrolase superfamily lysophospholipase
MQALHLAARKRTRFDALIASAAAVHIKRNLIMQLQEPFAAIMRRLVPRAAVVPALEEEKLSRDPTVVCIMTLLSICSLF